MTTTGVRVWIVGMPCVIPEKKTSKSKRDEGNECETRASGGEGGGRGGGGGRIERERERARGGTPRQDKARSQLRIAQLPKLT